MRMYDDKDNRKLNLSLVIPFVSDIEKREVIVQSYLSSNIVDQIRIQFLFLANGKTPFGLELSSINECDTHEIVYVGNDRFFSSAEENIYRMRDFLDILQPWILIIGDTDEIVWDNLLSAIQVAEKDKIDAMLLNVENRLPKAIGGYSRQFSAVKLNDPVLQNSMVAHLMDGNVLGSNIAYSSILSMYGPIDWLSTIGSHIFSRTALQGIFKYRFVDHIYSLVYMQLLYFTEKPRNYMLFMNPVVIRVSNECADIPEGKEQDLGWYREHREVNGHAGAFWVSNYNHLLQIEQDALFNVVISSLGLSNVPAGNDEIGLKRIPFLISLLSWGTLLIDEKLLGRSFYFNGYKGVNRLDQDIWSLTKLMHRIVKINDQSDIYIDRDFVEKLRIVLVPLNSYFALDCQTPAILQQARGAIVNALLTFTEEIIREFHGVSFLEYCNEISQ